MIDIAPSILNADFSCLEKEIKKVKEAKYLHLDIMDGSFVSNISYGPSVIKDIRPYSNLIFDTHLMVNNPGKHIKKFAEAGSDYITVHAEATIHLHRVIQQIKENGCKAGVALNPATSLDQLSWVINELDLVLIMSVNPGAGGQSFIQSMYKKIKKLREIIDSRDLKTKISVDGGINHQNLDRVIQAGTDIIVVGSTIFKSEDPEQALKKLKIKCNSDLKED